MTTLTFSRPQNLFLSIFRWHVLIDGKDVGGIKNNGQGRFDVEPGNHTIELRCYDVSKLIAGRYIYAKPISIDVPDNEEMTFEMAPHPLWNFSHKPKLFSNTESLILLPPGEKYAALTKTFDRERKTVQGYLDRVKFHNVTVIATLFSALYLVLTAVIFGSRVNDDLSLPFFCGIVSLAGLAGGRLNKWLLLNGFEWKHQLFLALLIIMVVLFDMTNARLIVLKDTYVLLAFVHLAITMVMYKKRPVFKVQVE